MSDVNRLSGELVDGWLLQEILGAGADGVVYTAHKEDGKRAAVKIFFPDALRKNGSEAAKERLELQLALAGRKQHPNLVEIYNGGELHQYDTLFLTMECVSGCSLDKLIGKIPLNKIPSLLGQLASAARHLEEELGLFHRDIKPANIVVSDDFEILTLLDLGVVHRRLDDEGGRLSGDEFVSTLRYSPPEFVWRTEEDGEDGAWRAITFYQIGATLYDMLTGRQIFSGEDTPRARLYDCVRDKTPDFPSIDFPPWLIQTAQGCLLKDWRQRLQFVTWDSFSSSVEVTNMVARERGIRLRQARAQEALLAAKKKNTPSKTEYREGLLWQLNSDVFGELRTYLLDSPIFSKFSVHERIISDHEYETTFMFEADDIKGFTSPWSSTVSLSISSVVKEATELKYSALLSGQSLNSTKWTEMFTVESALSNCQQALLDSVEAILSKTFEEN